MCVSMCMYVYVYVCMYGCTYSPRITPVKNEFQCQQEIKFKRTLIKTWLRNSKYYSFKMTKLSNLMNVFVYYTVHAWAETWAWFVEQEIFVRCRFRIFFQMTGKNVHFTVKNSLVIDHKFEIFTLLSQYFTLLTPFPPCFYLYKWPFS